MKTGVAALARTLFWLFTGWSSTGLAQDIPVEVMVGNRNYYYQHSFHRIVHAPMRIGFFHTASLYHYFDKDQKAESMMQAYLTYSASPSVKVAVGTFYASGPGFKPALALQIARRYKNSFLLVVPRMDLTNAPSFEVMALVEYTPRLNEKLLAYTRFQIMSNALPGTHNRSYQNARAGVQYKKAQFGLALNVDEYGAERDTYFNLGVFLRYDL